MKLGNLYLGNFTIAEKFENLSDIIIMRVYPKFEKWFIKEQYLNGHIYL